jgi:Terminase small subunit
MWPSSTPVAPLAAAAKYDEPTSTPPARPSGRAIPRPRQGKLGIKPDETSDFGRHSRVDGGQSGSDQGHRPRTSAELETQPSETLDKVEKGSRAGCAGDSEVMLVELSPKQKRFVEECLIDLNSTQAAIRAGYSEASAAEI